MQALSRKSSLIPYRRLTLLGQSWAKLLWQKPYWTRFSLIDLFGGSICWSFSSLLFHQFGLRSECALSSVCPLPSSDLASLFAFSSSIPAQTEGPWSGFADILLTPTQIWCLQLPRDQISQSKVQVAEHSKKQSNKGFFGMPPLYGGYAYRKN